MISCSTCGVAHVERVAGAGGVVVVAGVVRVEAVVAGVVDAPERQRRAEMVAFGGVVVDDVEDHLDAGVVQGADHRLELVDDLVARAGSRTRCAARGRRWSCSPSSSCRPVSTSRWSWTNWWTGMSSTAVIPEGAEVVDHDRVGQARVGALLLGWHARVAGGQALDVGLVDDGLVPRRARRAVVRPVEVGVRHDRLGHERSRIGVVADSVVLAQLVRVDRRIPLDLAVDRLGVGVEEQLVGIAAQAAGRVVGAVDPEPVPLPGLIASM